MVNKTRLDILADIYKIYQYEQSVGWFNIDAHTPGKNWASIDGNIILKDVAFARRGPNVVTGVLSCAVVMRDTDLKFTIGGHSVKSGLYDPYNTQYTQEYLADPLATYLERHDHELCIDALDKLLLGDKPPFTGKVAARNH